MQGIVEVLMAFQERLNAGLDFDDRRAIVKVLVKGVVVETQTCDDGEPYSVAHVTYRFERPEREVPLPIELAPIFHQWRQIDEFTNLL